jgi:hypothetical protein
VIGAGQHTIPVAGWRTCHLLPVLSPSLPLRICDPSGSWPFGPATLANCVRTRLENLQENCASRTPRSPLTPRPSAFEASNWIIVRSPLTYR